MTIEHTLGKKEVLELLNDARRLRILYEQENRKNPASHYAFPESVDGIALDQLERQEGVVVVSVGINNGHVNLGTIDGKLLSNGTPEFLFSGQTSTYRLTGYKDSTTIARFARSAAAIVHERKLHGPSELQSVMPASNYARQTLHQMEKFI